MVFDSIKTVRKLVSGSVKGLRSNIVRSPGLAKLNDLVVLQSVGFATMAGSKLTSCPTLELSSLPKREISVARQGVDVLRCDDPPPGPMQAGQNGEAGCGVVPHCDGPPPGPIAESTRRGEAWRGDVPQCDEPRFGPVRRRSKDYA